MPPLQQAVIMTPMQRLAVARFRIGRNRAPMVGLSQQSVTDALRLALQVVAVPDDPIVIDFRCGDDPESLCAKYECSPDEVDRALRRALRAGPWENYEERDDYDEPLPEPAPRFTSVTVSYAGRETVIRCLMTDSVGTVADAAAYEFDVSRGEVTLQTPQRRFLVDCSSQAFGRGMKIHRACPLRDGGRHAELMPLYL